MPKYGRTPRYSHSPTTGKKPTFTQIVAEAKAKAPKAQYDGDEFYRLRPAWRISMLGMISPYGWHEVEETKIREIREKLAHFENMTWRDILIGASKQNHKIGVDELSPAAKNRLQELRQDDIDFLISLHLSAKERVWGILESNILKVLWWDPNHEICPSPKRHT